MGISCGKSLAPPPIKARNIFASVEDLIPTKFAGSREHLITHTGEQQSSFNVDRRPLICATGEGSFIEPYCRWFAASVLSLNTGGRETSSLCVSTQWNFRSTTGCTFVAANLDPKSGNWNFETMGRSVDGLLDASVIGQVCAWNQFRSIQFDVDHSIQGKTASLSIDPILKKCSFSYIQAVSSRLSIGGELAFGKSFSVNGKPMGTFQPSIMAKYVGSKYEASGKMNPIAGSKKFTYYHHYTDKVQVGIVHVKDEDWSKTSTRLAFRKLSDHSVFRAALGTDCIVNSQWERRLGDHVSVSLSGFLHLWYKDYGFGLGLSLI